MGTTSLRRGDGISAGVRFAFVDGSPGRGEGGGGFLASARRSIRDIGAGCAAGVIRVVEISLGGLGVENPSGVRRPEVLGLLLRLRLGLAGRISEGGRGLVRAAWLPPGRICGASESVRGETTRPWPHDLNFFLRGVYGGAWNGAQAEVARGRNRLAVSPQKRPRAAGAGAEWNAPECPAKKRTWFSPCPGRCERSECRCVTTVLDVFELLDPGEALGVRGGPLVVSARLPSVRMFAVGYPGWPLSSAS